MSPGTPENKVLTDELIWKCNSKPCRDRSISELMCSSVTIAGHTHAIVSGPA